MPTLQEMWGRQPAQKKQKSSPKLQPKQQQQQQKKKATSPQKPAVRHRKKRQPAKPRQKKAARQAEAKLEEQVAPTEEPEQPEPEEEQQQPEKEPEEEGLSAYEKQRLANIRRNEKILADLGLSQTTSEMRASLEKQKKKKAAAKRSREAAREKWSAEVGSRSSKRRRGQKPDYTREKIDSFGDELDAQAEGKKRLPRGKTPSGKTDYSGVIVEARAWLEEGRKMLAQGKGNEALPKGQAEWRDRAIKKWGHRVSQLDIKDWESYVLSRTPNPAPASPLELMQERFVDCIWRLLIACVLMSRVSSVETKERAISGFFRRYPTPSAAVEADPQDIFDIIKSLGLFDNRLKAVIDISSKFLSLPEFKCDLTKENKIAGIGQFGYDSYLIFCRNQGSKLVPDDRNLAAYCRWAKSQEAGATGSGGGSSE